MEWLNKFTNPLAERAKSPLYGAFLFSWLIWNWRIVLTVLMPSQVKFEGLGLTTYISTHFLNICDSIIIPLAYAIFYIFALPWIDLLLIMYTEEQKRKKIDEKIKIGRKHSVLGDLYYDLKIAFEEEKQRIDKADITNKILKGDLLKQENKVGELEGKIGEHISKNNVLQNEINEVKDKNHIYQMKVNQFENRKNLKNRFEGRWHLKYKDTENPNFQGSEEIEITGNNYWIINGPNDKQHAFEIMVPDYDVEQKYFTFVKYNLKVPGSHTVNFLNIISNNRLEGFENKTIAVTYTKSEVQ
jgi:hypothetical protein